MISASSVDSCQSRFEAVSTFLGKNRKRNRALKTTRTTTAHSGVMLRASRALMGMPAPQKAATTTSVMSARKICFLV